MSDMDRDRGRSGQSSAGRRRRPRGGGGGSGHGRIDRKVVVDLVGHLEYGIEVCKGIPESLGALEVGDVHWPRVPVTDGPRIKGELTDRDYDVETTPTTPSRPPIILAKHSGDQSQHSGGSRTSQSQSTSPTPLARQPEKPVMVLKPRDETSRPLSAASSLPSIPVATAQGEMPQPAYHLQRPQAVPQQTEERTKLVVPPDMTKCLKLIDDTNQWSETASEMLLDQTDFLVVGVLGLQGSGKSTIMSLLAGNTDEDGSRSYIFPPQSRDTKEKCAHQTSGIDIFVTPQRIVLLDAQMGSSEASQSESSMFKKDKAGYSRTGLVKLWMPLLSASVLEGMIRNEKKLPPEYTMAENWTEMQCLQQSTFLMTVCHVILVVQDWFSDVSLLRFLLSAEMLKPSTLSGSHGSGSGQDDMHEFFPQLVFVQNRAVRDDFSLENYKAMQQTLEAVFNTSRLKITGAVNMSTGRQVMGLNPKFVSSDVNLFLLPSMDSKDNRKGDDPIMTMLPEYRGFPSFNTLINSLRSQIFSLPRETLTHTTLTEKNWFHFAARTWDAIRKSQLIAEYNRLLP